MRVVIAGARGLVGRHLVAALQARQDEVLLHDRRRGRDRALVAALIGADAVVALAEGARGMALVAAVVDALALVPPTLRPLVMVSLSSPAGTDDEGTEREALRARALGTRVVVLSTGQVLHRAVPGGKRQAPDARAVGSVDLDDVIGFTLHALRAWDVAGPVHLVGAGSGEQRIFGAAERSGYRFGCGSVRDAACSIASGP